MFKLRPSNVCQGSVGGDCSLFSIWNWKSIMGGSIGGFSNQVSFCGAEAFPFIYWTTLFLSILGLVNTLNILNCFLTFVHFQLNSVWEFARIYHGCETLSTFRKRHYKFLPFPFRRNSRLITTVFSMKAWILLLVGILVVSPYLMSLWLRLNMFIIGIDFVILILEILLNETELRFTTFLSEAFYMISVLFVRCVRNVFQDAVEQNETENLQLFR